MKTRWFWVVGALLLSTTVLVACGDDEGGKPVPDGGDADGGDGDGDGDGDAGGMGGGGGSGGTGGSGGMAPLPPVECGEESCEQPAPLGGGLMIPGFPDIGALLPQPRACCLDEASGACGITSAMTPTECNMIAEPDTRCPDVDLGLIGMFLGAAGGYGCCVDNQCGVDASAFGGGCTENGEAASNPMLGMLMGVITIPPPQSCDGSGSDGGDGDGDDGGS